MSLHPPPRFLVVERGLSEVKALTPEDSKLWARKFSDGERAGLAFWRDALKADLVEARGFAVLSETPRRDPHGHEGVELVLESTVAGRPMRELLVLFVEPGVFDDTLQVVEYVADAKTFDAEVESVRQSLIAP